MKTKRRGCPLTKRRRRDYHGYFIKQSKIAHWNSTEILSGVKILFSFLYGRPEMYIEFFKQMTKQT